MANFSVWMLGASDISISGGGSLSGITQGDGSHLVGRTLRLDTNAWQQTYIADGGTDTAFDDNDAGQVLNGAQTINGVTYSGGTRVEGEYHLTLQDTATGQTWDVIGYNVVNSNPAYATVEGLAFVGPVGGFPPVGVDLRVVNAAEGPGASGQASIDAGNLASPPCLTTGCVIATPSGPVAIENLCPGDLVWTRNGPARPVRWVGKVVVGARDLATRPAFRPVRIARGAFCANLPERDTLMSQQHRILLSDWRAEMFYGLDEVLVAARSLINDHSITIANDVTSVTYYHLLFDQHEIIEANGIETESFNPGPRGIAALPQASRDEIFALFPSLRDPDTTAGSPAAPVLKGWEASILR